MQMVYNLIMIDEDTSFDKHKETFNIGFFSDRERAEKTAKKYLSDVDGFKDYNISCQMIEKRLIGYHDCLKLSELFIIYG